MKLFTAKYLSLLLLACATTGSIQASRYEDGQDCCRQSCFSNCFSSCYECGCNPLYCGAWDLQLQGGVDPILWRQHDADAFINCAGDTPLVVSTEVSKFSHFFKTPWIVGGQIGYHWSDNARLYLEFNYSQAKAKNLVVPTLAAGTAVLETSGLGKYKIFDAYVGARYYWDRWCDRVAFFLGAKVGLTHHKRNNSNVTFQSSTIVTPLVLATDAEIFRSNTVVSGGANAGFDICFCGNWSLVITGEVVASCGPRSNSNVVLVPVAPVTTTNLFVGDIGNELRFPVTAGIRYSF